MDNKTPELTNVSFLLVENNPSSVQVIKDGLNGFGAQVYTAMDYKGAVDVLASQRINVIIASIYLVDEEYIKVVNDYKSLYPDTVFYLLVEGDHDSVEAEKDSAKLVIDDYIKKPIEFERFAKIVNSKFGKSQTGKNTSLSVIEPFVKKVKSYFLYRSPIMQHILSNLPDIAASNQTVLVTGETGTGKEIVARAIHVLSKRVNGPFVPLNCGAIPENLIEAELFGHEKGAFTNAIKTRKGRFESADKGTLFLDEIGDMSLNMQVRLLRVLEERRVYKVGSDDYTPIDVRVITATRIDLEMAVENKLFREDLYYRINILRLNLPPLHQRKEDISLLTVHFLDRAFAEMDRPLPFPELSPEAIFLLEGHPWKGNVRELRNIMTRLATLLPPDTKRIFPFHIIPHLNDKKRIVPQPSSEKSSSGIYIPTGASLEEAGGIIIKETLKLTNGNKTKAAAMLGISIRTLRRKLQNTTLL
ncbi:MAG: sigma-54-dependent transcriptional regulator [Candidatus Anammoxibacter sp.]